MDPFTGTKSPVSKRPKSRLRAITWAASACLCVLILLGVFALVAKDDELIELAKYSVWARGGLVPRQPRLEKAIAILSGPSNVVGTVTFFQPKGRGPVIVHGTIKNLDPNASRGFHVHQAGDLGNGCLNAGAHYNPFNKTHGAPTDAIRHVGDLGNVGSNDVGIADFTIKDKQLTLNGPLSILGRAVVVHAGTDDLGKGGNEESLKTGNAGARLACGVIGISA